LETNIVAVYRVKEITERSWEPKSGVKSGNISTWVFNKQISGPTCKCNENIKNTQLTHHQ